MPLFGTEFVWDHRKNKVCQEKQALRAGCRPSVYQTHQTLSTPSFSVGRVPYLAAVVLVFFRLRNHFGFLSHGVERKYFYQLRCIMHIRAGWRCDGTNIYSSPFLISLRFPYHIISWLRTNAFWLCLPRCDMMLSPGGPSPSPSTKKKRRGTLLGSALSLCYM